jgi:transposase InsO family protein
VIASLKESRPEVSERSLRRLSSVSRPWCYGKPRAAERRAGKGLDLRGAIERIVLEFPGYGYRRVSAELHRRGFEANRKRVLRIMREESLLCQLKRRLKPTTDSAHGFGIYPNPIKDMELDGVSQAWISDITYIRLPAAFCCLAAILDACSRRCVGWRLSRRIDASLALSALEMALATRRPDPGLVHHSDRGVQGEFTQYASSECTARLEEAGSLISMAAVGNPYENAKAESFFRSLKMEEVYLKDCRDFEEAEEDIGQFIEEVCNQERLHSSLGHLPPVEFEAIHAPKIRS